MNKTRHLIVSILLSLFILIVGTTGYMIIEDWRFLDALYMTVITISMGVIGKLTRSAMSAAYLRFFWLPSVWGLHCM